MNIFRDILTISLLCLISIQVFGQDCNIPINLGHFGDQSTILNDAPETSNFKAIAAGGGHIVAVREDGTVIGWGNNSYGQSNIPEGLTGVIAVAAGDRHCVALKEDGTLVAWGDNRAGQSTIPEGLQGVKAISSRGSANLALKEDGTVVGWGHSEIGTYSGQLDYPENLSGVKAISLGNLNGIALLEDGTVEVWGDNSYGQTMTPPGLKNIKAVAAGDQCMLAVNHDGTVVSWSNCFGTPKGLTGVKEIIANTLHIVALTEDGKVVAWGLPRIIEVPAGLSGVRAIATDIDFTIYLAPSCNASVESASLPNANISQPYSYTLNANGICDNPNWSVVSGNLPSGLQLSEDGTLFGTPEESIESQFRLKVKDKNCEAEKDFTLKVNGVDNIANSEFPDLQIYPNPAANFIDIKLTQMSDDISLTLFDSKGTEVLKTDNLSQRIDISSLNNGLYYIQLTSSQKTTHLKLIKN
jgi:hypothetical protein